MTANSSSSNESHFLLPSVLSGVAVAALLSLKDDYFLDNFAFYWLPQAIVLASYLALFGVWVFSRPHPESMAWLGYLSSIPGAGLGAIAGAFYVKRRSYTRAVIAGVVAALFTFAGLAINQLVVCSTVMYCGS